MRSDLRFQPLANHSNQADQSSSKQSKSSGLGNGREVAIAAADCASNNLPVPGNRYDGNLRAAVRRQPEGVPVVPRDDTGEDAAAALWGPGNFAECAFDDHAAARSTAGEREGSIAEGASRCQTRPRKRACRKARRARQWYGAAAKDG